MNRIERRFFREQEEKKLLALDRKKQELWNKSREPVEYIEVKPIRDGWIRYFDLREDLKGRPDYSYLKEILDICNCKQFCRSKNFKRKKSNFVYGYLDKDFHLKNLIDKEHKGLSERAKLWFWREEKIYTRGSIYNVWHPFIEKWMLVVKTKPHYIRYFKVFDNEAKSEYDRIENEFNRRNLYPKLDHILGLKPYWRDDWDLNFNKKRLASKIAKKEMEEEAYNFFV
jgi:hypothetical protein